MSMQGSFFLRRLANRLLCGGAIAGLIAVPLTPADAQEGGPAVETVIVTGTAIRGAAPVGANVIALERVEVLPDGASSIYGSDAVAGVLNFITRKNFSGAETEIEYGNAADYNSVSFGQILGAAWSKGSFMAAYEFTGRSKLLGTDRAFVNDNQSFRGLSNFGNFNCGPATVSPASGVGAGLIFPYPYNGAGIANAQAGAICGQTPYASLLPSENRNAALLSVRDDLTDWLSVSADVNWSNRLNDAAISRGVITATVFGPGSGKGTQINPFYVAVPGNGSGQETVRYDFNSLFGAGAHTKFGTQTVFGTADADIRLGGDWTVSLETLFGSTSAFTRTIGAVCQACAYLALNGTTNSAGNPAASSNPAVLSTTTLTTRSLTAANALNVWSSGAAGTPSVVLTQLLDNNNFAQTTQNMNDVNLKFSGTLFALPAGDVKTALGGEYRNTGIWEYLISNGAGGPSITNSSILNAAFGRSQCAAYAEFLLPLIGPEADIPLVRALDLDISGRYDHYSDVGGTANPRIAATWEVWDGLKARGSYGTSFVAPALTSTGGAAGLSTESSVSYGATNNAPVTVPAGYSDMGPGNSTQSVLIAAGQVVGNAANQGILVAGPGGATVRPQTALTYSAGFDWDAGKFVPALSGLSLSATYWQAKIVGAITAPIASLDTQLAALSKNLVINPTDAQIAAAYNGTRRVNSVPSGPVTFIQYFLQQNAFNLYADGIDFAADYRFSLQGFGDFHAGLEGSEKLRFSQQAGGFGGPIVDNLNRNNNTTFSSLAFAGRGTLGWTMDPLTAAVFLNWTTPYYQTTTTFKVPANVTVDASLAYALPAIHPYLAGAQVYVTVDNLFDQAPPPYNVAVGYDAADASPLGRLILIGLRKKW
jgi:iron complex outermembrane receptor protein